VRFAEQRHQAQAVGVEQGLGSLVAMKAVAEGDDALGARYVI
jgi:hypothetical protein